MWHIMSPAQNSVPLGIEALFSDYYNLGDFVCHYVKKCVIVYFKTIGGEGGGVIYTFLYP